MDFFKFMFYTMGDHIYSYYTFFIIYKSLFKNLLKVYLKELLKKYFYMAEKEHFKRLIKKTY